MLCKALSSAIIGIVVMSVSPALADPTCPINYGARAHAKPNKLYLYFPTKIIDDPSVFPPYGFNPDTPWLPLNKFDSADLPAYTRPEGHPDASRTVEALRNRIQDVVADIFCEFNVQVIQTTDALDPPRPGERRNVIGFATDAFLEGRDCEHKYTLGQAKARAGDAGDATAVDFARIWAGTCQACAGSPGGALHGRRKSKLDRWANAIGSTAAHEVAHNYGLSHADGFVIPRRDEDQWDHHVMRGGYKREHYEFDDRALPRHLSDFETSVLARNVGLAIDTMWAWDFVNPNTATGAKLRMEILSTTPTLILSWPFAESTSPWINPTLSESLGKRTRKGKGNEYYVYAIEWSAGQPWSEVPGGPPTHPSGRVPGGSHFQVGATFSSASQSSEPAAVIITDVTLFDEYDRALPKNPHWMGFDAGTLDSATGDLNLLFFNVFDRPLILRDVVVQDLPRVMSIKSMTRNQPIDGPVFDVSNLPDRKFARWETLGIRRPLVKSKVEIQPGEEFKLPVASLGHGQHIFLQRNDRNCKGSGPAEALCHPGRIVDLFPATTMYITATIVDPKGVESRLFHQVAGRRVQP